MRDLERKKFVGDYIISQIRDKKIAQAFLDVPRHEFVPQKFAKEAYMDYPLEIGAGQTISQPSLVAKMTELLGLKGNENVLEVGTGSGFQAAILSKLAKNVFTIERFEALAEKAKEKFEKLGIKNIHVFVGDGTLGLEEYAPFDAIVVTAGAQRIPEALVEQLKNGGKIVIPVDTALGEQMLKFGVKENGGMKFHNIIPVRFVPLVGKY